MATRIMILLSLSICLCACTSSKIANIPTVLSNKHDINIAVQKAFVDNLDQLYILTPNGVLIKYDQNLVELYRYADNTLGAISHIDVYNPLNTLVYHRQYNTIAYLDNTLALLKKQDLQDFELYDINTIAASNDGKLWLYDPTKNQLIKINDTGRTIISSNSLNDYGLADLDPVKIVERFNMLFVFDPAYGIILFDNLGQYIKVLPLKNIDNFQSDGKTIITFEKPHIKLYSIKLLEEQIIVPKEIEDESNYDQIILSPKYYYYIYKDGVSRAER